MQECLICETLFGRSEAHHLDEEICYDHPSVQVKAWREEQARPEQEVR